MVVDSSVLGFQIKQVPQSSVPYSHREATVTHPACFHAWSPIFRTHMLRPLEYFILSIPVIRLRHLLSLDHTSDNQSTMYCADNTIERGVRICLGI
jgi:hypothetical protein